MATDVKGARIGSRRSSEQTPRRVVVEEVSRDLFRLALPLPYDPRWVNVFVDRGHDGAVVFDAGTDDARCREELEHGLRAIDVSLPMVREVVITHLHIDHYGLAGWLARRSGGTVRLHEAATFLLDRHLRPRAWIAEFERFLRQHGTPPAVAATLAELEDWTPWLSPLHEYVPFRDADAISGGGRMWRAVHTPGHTADHTCFHDASEAILVSGDHVLPDYTPHLRYVDVDMVDPVETYLAGLDRVDNLGVRAILPGHGGVITDPNTRTRALREQQSRLQTRLHAQLERPKTAYQLTLDHHGRELPDFHLRLAIQQMVAQLRHLQMLGRVEAVASRGVVSYRAANSDGIWPRPGVVQVSEVVDGA